MAIGLPNQEGGRWTLAAAVLAGLGVVLGPLAAHAAYQVHLPGGGTGTCTVGPAPSVPPEPPGRGFAWPRFLSESPPAGSPTGNSARVVDAVDDGWVGLVGNRVTYDFAPARIVDRPGPDFIVYQYDFADPGRFGLIDVLVSANGVDFVSVKGSEGPVPTERRIPGDIAHTNPAGRKSYDITGSGISEVRYVRIQGAAGTQTPGFQLDAVGAIHYSGEAVFPAICCDASCGNKYCSFPGVLKDNSTGFADWVVLNGPDHVFAPLPSGSSVTYDFAPFLVLDGSGPDLTVYEVDFGGAEFSQIDVLASEDGANFISLKTSEAPMVRLPGDGPFKSTVFGRSYDIGPWLARARYVRIVEGTAPASDCCGGFDLDAIGAVHLGSCWASAGTSQSAPEGTVVQLSGSGLNPALSCIDTSVAAPSYLWEQAAGPAVTLSGATTANPIFVAPEVAVGGATLSFQLTVNGCASDVVDVTVTNVNREPVAVASGPMPTQEGSLITLDGSGSFDPDQDPLALSWVQLSGPAVTLSDATAVKPTFLAPPVGVPGAILVFELTVSDGAASATDTVEVHITHVNQRPHARAGDPQTVDEQNLVTLDASGSSDPENDPLTYAWVQTGGPAVTLSDGTHQRPSFTAPLVTAGGATLTFQVSVSDGALADTDSVVITVQNLFDPPLCALARPALGPRSARSADSQLWPADHKMVEVGIIGVSDPQGSNVTLTILSVTQDEPNAGLGDGDSYPDALEGELVFLRAERKKGGNGRVYKIRFRAQGEFGEFCEATVSMCVPPKDKHPCIDDGLVYPSQ